MLFPMSVVRDGAQKQKIQKSDIILEGSGHPNFMNRFQYSKSFHNKTK